MSLIDELHSLRSEIEAKLTFIDAKISDLQPESVAPVPASQFYAESSEPMRWLLEGLIAEGSVGLMVAHGGIGKAQPDDALVLTPTGWSRIDTLSVGDTVVGGDGRPTKVTGVFPQGEKEIFRVGMKDGGSAECCADHLWLVSERLPWGKLMAPRVLPLRDFMHRLKADDGERFFSLPFTAPVHGEGRQLPIDPYALGAYLGDGTSNGSVVLHDVDQDVLARFSASLPPGDESTPHTDLGVRVRKVSKATGRGKPPATFLLALRVLGLHGLRSHEKFIPGEYMQASVAQRTALLQGLLDTDGYVSGTTVEFSSASELMAEQVAQLCWSLGGKAHVMCRPAGYRKDGEFYPSRDSHRVTMTFPHTSVTPVSSSKHLAKWAPAVHSRRFIDSVESAGHKPCRCIKVANADGLYVTNDWIVTHNTTLLTQLGLCLADGRPVFGFPVPSPAPVLYVMAEGSRAAYRDRWTLTRRALEIPATANWYIQPATFADFTLGHSGLDALVAQSKAKLVILDTLGYFHHGDENKANDWKMHVMAPLRAMCQRYGSTFVLVHHQTKASPDRQGWQQGRGTSAMYGDVDFWLRLEKVEGDGNEAKRELWIDKNKYGPMGYRKKLVFVAEHAFFRSEA